MVMQQSDDECDIENQNVVFSFQFEIFFHIQLGIVMIHSSSSSGPLSAIANLASKLWYMIWYMIFIWYDMASTTTVTDKTTISWHDINQVHDVMSPKFFLYILLALWESTSHQWIPLTKGQQCRVLIFCLLLAWTSCWTVELTVIWDDMTLMWHHYNVSQVRRFNTLRLRQNGLPFPDVIFKCIFFNKNAGISIKISLKFVPEG